MRQTIHVDSQHKSVGETLQRLVSVKVSHYATIQSAIDSVSDEESEQGVTILVENGFYPEAVALKAGVSLQAVNKGQVLIESTTAKPAITSKAVSGKVSGFQLRQTGWSYDQDICCVEISGSDVLIEDCDVMSNDGVGFLIYDEAKPTIKNCLVDRCGDVGFMIFGNSAGIISENTISRNGGTAIKISEGSNPLIKNNKFASQTLGIIYDKSSNPQLEENSFEQVGIPSEQD